MKTDKELLELAARAYSNEVFEGWGGYGSDCEAGKFYYLVGKNGGRREWNPLTNDGDALRLAVKLNLTVDVGDTWVNIFYNNKVLIAAPVIVSEKLEITRRAIVRAAAAIGEKL